MTTIKWTNKPTPSEGYYYYCSRSRREVGIVHFDANEKMLDDDVHSLTPITLPKPPRKKAA